MNNLAIQWIVLAVCALGAFVRLPGVLHGRGRMVFTALVLLTIAVALSLDVIYLVVDSLMGGVNLANLLIRFLLYAVFLLIGVRMAAAFDSPGARRLIAGPFGIAVLIVTISATLYFFLASELQGSSTGLRDFGYQDTVLQYAAVGRLYPAYVAACLVVPGVRAAFDRGSRPLHRVASGLLACGFAIVDAYVVLRLMPIELHQWDIILPFLAILLTVLGLCLIWLSHIVSRRGHRQANKLA
jgi:hypothetical protein